MSQEILFKINCYMMYDDKYFVMSNNNVGSGRLYLTDKQDETCIFYFKFVDGEYLLQTYNGDYIQIKNDRCKNEGIYFNTELESITLGIIKTGGTVIINSKEQYLAYNSNIQIVENADVLYGVDQGDATLFKIKNSDFLSAVEKGAYYSYNHIHYTQDETTFFLMEKIIRNKKINSCLKSIEYEISVGKDQIKYISNLRLIYEGGEIQVRQGTFRKDGVLNVPSTTTYSVTMYTLKGYEENGNILAILIKTIQGEIVSIIADKCYTNTKKCSCKEYKFSQYGVLNGFDVKLKDDILYLYPLEYSAMYVYDPDSNWETNWNGICIERKLDIIKKPDIIPDGGILSSYIKIDKFSEGNLTKIFGFISRKKEDNLSAKDASFYVYYDGQDSEEDVHEFYECFDKRCERSRGYFEISDISKDYIIEIRAKKKSEFFFEVQVHKGDVNFDNLWQAFEYLQSGMYHRYLRPKWKACDCILSLPNISWPLEVMWDETPSEEKSLLSMAVTLSSENVWSISSLIKGIVKSRKTIYKDAKVYRIYHGTDSRPRGSTKNTSVVKSENVTKYAQDKSFDVFRVNEHAAYESLGEFAVNFEKMDKYGKLKGSYAVYGFSHYSRCFNLRYDIAPRIGFLKLESEEEYWHAFDYQHGYTLADILYYMDGNAFPCIERYIYDLVIGDYERLGQEIDNSTLKFWEQYVKQPHLGVDYIKRAIEDYLKNTKDPFFKYGYLDYQTYIQLNIFFFKCQILCNREIMEKYLNMLRSILEKVAYDKDYICKKDNDYNRVWAFMGERIYSIFAYICYQKNQVKELNYFLSPVICYKEIYDKRGGEGKELDEKSIRDIRKQCIKHYVKNYEIDMKTEFERDRYVYAIFEKSVIKIYEYDEFSKGIFPENIEEKYGILYENNIPVCSFNNGQSQIFCLSWRVRPSRRYLEMSQICGMVFVHMLGDKGDTMENIVDVSLYMEATDYLETKLYIMLDKNQKGFCVYDVYDKENVRVCQSIQLYVKLNDRESGYVTVGYDFEEMMFYCMDLDDNIIYKKRFITVKNWEGYYDTYFGGEYVFKKQLDEDYD